MIDLATFALFVSTSMALILVPGAEPRPVSRLLRHLGLAVRDR